MSSKEFTYTLTNDTLTWDRNWGYKRVSLKLISGAATVKGAAIIPRTSTAIDLALNEAVTFINENMVGELVINASSGSVQIIASQN